MTFLTALAMTLLGGAVGYGVTWLRPDLDLSPKSAGLASLAIGAVIGAAWLLFGRGDLTMAPLLSLAAPLIWIDARRMILPDMLTLPLIALGLLVALAGGGFVDAAFGAALGYGVFRLIGLAWERFRGVDALGHGDAKLLGAIGAWFGAAVLPQIVLIAAILGIAAALIRRVASGRDDIPFGPPLLVAAIATTLTRPILF